MNFIKSISPSTAADQELITAYKASGNLQVLGQLYERYMELVYGVCLKYLQDPDTAKDSVISIFEELVNKVKKHEISYFKGWLYQLAKNHCLMQLRSEKKFSKASVDINLMQNEEAVHLNGELDKEENFKHMQHCLGQLIAEQKTVIELFYLQGKSYNEISEATGIDWNKVRSFIQNGRRNLKICMEKQINVN